MKCKKGFTIIEVAIFLAISGALFAMVMANMSGTVARRRYNDSVSDFVENIKNGYSETINVENYRTQKDDSSYFCSIASGQASKETGVNDNYPGRTKCAVYGQVITFGEGNKPEIHHYTIIGRAVNDNIDPNGNDDILSALRTVGADIVTITQTDEKATQCRASVAGNYSTYSPQWGAIAEFGNKDRDIYKGAIVIARSPISGTIHTFFYTDSGDITKNNKSTFEVQEWVKSHSSIANCNSFASSIYSLSDALDEKKIVYGNELHPDSSHPDQSGIAFCVGSEDLGSVGNQRRAIMIHSDGSTESAVELLSEGDSAVACKK